MYIYVRICILIVYLPAYTTYVCIIMCVDTYGSMYSSKLTRPKNYRRYSQLSEVCTLLKMHYISFSQKVSLLTVMHTYGLLIFTLLYYYRDRLV